MDNAEKLRSALTQFYKQLNDLGLVVKEIHVDDFADWMLSDAVVIVNDQRMKPKGEVVFKRYRP